MISGEAVGHIAFDIFVDYLAKIGKHRALSVKHLIMLDQIPMIIAR